MTRFSDQFVTVYQNMLKLRRVPNLTPDQAGVLVDWVETWEKDQATSLDWLLREMVRGELARTSLRKVIAIKVRAAMETVFMPGVARGQR